MVRNPGKLSRRVGAVTDDLAAPIEQHWSPRVLVTGTSGFIAGHCVTELAATGTPCGAPQPGKVAHPADSAELVTADLEPDDDWAEVVAGCRYVLHVASPFPPEDPAGEDELIRPAVQGTLRVLRAAAASGTVTRVVLASSIAAIVVGRLGTGD